MTYCNVDFWSDTCGVVFGCCYCCADLTVVASNMCGVVVCCCYYCFRLLLLLHSAHVVVVVVCCCYCCCCFRLLLLHSIRCVGYVVLTPALFWISSGLRSFNLFYPFFTKTKQDRIAENTFSFSKEILQIYQKSVSPIHRNRSMGCENLVNFKLLQF